MQFINYSVKRGEYESNCKCVSLQPIETILVIEGSPGERTKNEKNDDVGNLVRTDGKLNSRYRA